MYHAFQQNVENYVLRLENHIWTALKEIWQDFYQSLKAVSTLLGDRKFFSRSLLWTTIMVHDTCISILAITYMHCIWLYSYVASVSYELSTYKQFFQVICLCISLSTLALNSRDWSKNGVQFFVPPNTSYNKLYLRKPT